MLLLIFYIYYLSLALVWQISTSAVMICMNSLILQEPFAFECYNDVFIAAVHHISYMVLMLLCTVFLQDLIVLYMNSAR